MGLAIAAADRRCTSVAVVLPGTLDGVLDPEPRGGGVDRFATALQPAPLLARAVRGLARRRAEHRVRLTRDVGTVLGRTPVFFFFLGRPQMWSDLDHALWRVVQKGGSQAARNAFRTYVRTEGRFGLQPLSSQEAVRRILVNWLTRQGSAPTESIQALQPSGSWQRAG